MLTKAAFILINYNTLSEEKKYKSVTGIVPFQKLHIFFFL